MFRYSGAVVAATLLLLVGLLVPSQCAVADTLYAISANYPPYLYTMSVDGASPGMLGPLTGESGRSVSGADGQLFIGTIYGIYAINSDGSVKSELTPASGMWLQYDAVSNKLVFSDNSISNKGIGVISPNGGTETSLLDVSALLGTSNYSLGGIRVESDGKILFATFQSGGTSKIWEVNPDGTGAHVIYDTHSNNLISDFVQTASGNFIWTEGFSSYDQGFSFGGTSELFM